MKPAHTPGPWHVDSKRGIAAAPDPHFWLAEVYSGGVGVKVADANGRLIAAAPELLAALQDLSDAVATDRAADTIPGLYQYVIKARAAIAKAKGEA